GARQACDEAGTDRINNLHENDRYGTGDMLQGRYADAGGSQNNVRRERDQFCRILSHGVCTRATPTIVDPHVAARTPPCFLQPLCERGNTSVPFRIISSQIDDHADAPHALALLRACRTRPSYCRAAEQRDERAAFHSITSSAMASTVAGMSKPSALAGLRLTISSYLVGACTGRSAGFSPLRIRST